MSKKKMKQRDANMQQCLCLTSIFIVLLCPRGSESTLPSENDAVICSSNNNSSQCQFGSKACTVSECQAAEGKSVNVGNFQKLAENEDNCKEMYKYVEGNYAASRSENDDGVSYKKVHYPDDPYYFQLMLDWKSWEDVEGYYVSINVIAQDDEGDPPPKLYSYRCIKAQPTDRMNLTFFMEYGLSVGYTKCQKSIRYFEASVIGLPKNPFHEVISYSKILWPRNCFDIIDDEEVCGFRSPGQVVISTETSLLPNSTSLMSALITWHNPSNTIATITEYEILLQTVDYFNSYTYSMNATTHSIILSPLSVSTTHRIYITPFQYDVCQYECIPGRQSSIVVCGRRTQKDFSYIPPPLPSPSPSTDPSQLTSSHPSLSVPTPSFSSFSSSLLMSSTLFSSASITPIALTTDAPISKYFTEVMIGIGVIALIVVVLVVVLMTALVKAIHSKRHMSQVEIAEDVHTLKSGSGSDSSSLPSTATSTRSPTPISPSPLLLQSPALSSTQFSYDHILYDERMVSSPYYHEPTTIALPLYYQEPHPDYIPVNIKLVLVVESSQMDEDFRKIHLTFLGCDLGKCEGIRVLHYNPCSRKPPSRWLMEYMSKADTVICVCTAEFMNEWRHSHEQSLVHPLRDYIVGSESTGKSLSDKYLTVTHSKEEMKYIPEELTSVRHCLIDNTDRIYRIITQRPKEIIV